MIPKIIHYCWVGRGEMPDLVKRCIESWHVYMPDWTYMLWDEDSVADYCLIHNIPSPIYDLIYCAEAYSAKKYAFVSDYVRLWVLEKFGGLYMDVDFEVYKSFEDLLDCPEGAFVGREGSKFQPPMLGVMASEAHSKWVTIMMNMYDSRNFIKKQESKNGKVNIEYDMTTNVSYFDSMGVHKPEWVKVYPVEYFCPVLTTGEDVRNQNTYCEHRGLHSWNANDGWKYKLLSRVNSKIRTKLIKLKRRLLR